MSIFTRGFELTTSLTNILIFIASVYGFMHINENKMWKLFYLFIIFASFLGVIVHGIVMSEMLKNILWVFLSIFLTLTINSLLCVFLKAKYRHVIILSILVMIMIATQMYFEFNYIMTFAFYALLIILVCSYYIIKENRWLILGVIFQIIGGILLLTRIKIYILDNNGLYHIFMVLTLICFYIGIKKKYKELNYEPGY